jgi:hypothetical protein
MNRRAADLPDGRLEDELRAAFSDATADLAPTTNPWARTRDAVARSRARRRAGALAGAAVTAVLGLLVVLHPPVHLKVQPAAPKVTTSDVSNWPTRGNLADRTDLVAAVSAKAADGGRRHVASVPYLGTIDDVTAALVIVDDSSEPPDTRYVVLVYGRQSRPVALWSIADASLRLTTVPVLTATFFDGGEWSRGIAVTLSRGVQLAWSPRPFVDRSGRTVRTYVPLRLDDGVGTWRTRWKAGLETVRADVSDRRTILEPQIEAVAPEQSSGFLLPNLSPGCSEDSSYLDLAYSGLGEAWNESAVRQTSVNEIRLLWCGRVDNEQAVLTGVTTNDGTDFQSLVERVSSGPAQGTTAQAWPVPPGRGLDYPMARELRGDAADANVPTATVTVVAPQGTSAELQQGVPPFVFGKHKLTADGYARIALSESDALRWRDTDKPAELVVRGGQGQVLDRVPTPAKNAWGDGIDGRDAPTDAVPVR